MDAKVKLRVIKGEFAGRMYGFDEGTVCTVGRSEDCLLRLPNNPLYQDVSRHHFVLEIGPTEVRVRDLGSRNGTFVNGTMIGRRRHDEDAAAVNTQEMPAHVLHDGDELRVGGTVFQVCLFCGEETSDRSNTHPELAGVI
jgi:pSer/pThr/pTyr-binding forkhead associated (FHA) protein